MGNRKQPFGYRMENGEIVIHPQEADTVRRIFCAYAEGNGFAALTEMLNKSEISYYPGKAWNKNMVARLLEDTRYAGENGFPVIICREQLDAAAALRKSKCAPCKITAAQKVLRRLCGYRPPAAVERQVLWLINRLIADPTILRCPNAMQIRASEEVEKLETQLERLLSDQPVDTAAAKSLILRLAAARYEELDSGEYETERLSAIFERMEPIDALDADLLTQTVSSIRIKEDHGVAIMLKNGPVLEGDAK